MVQASTTMTHLYFPVSNWCSHQTCSLDFTSPLLSITFYFPLSWFCCCHLHLFSANGYVNNQLQPLSPYILNFASSSFGYCHLASMKSELSPSPGSWVGCHATVFNLSWAFNTVQECPYVFLVISLATIEKDFALSINSCLA